MAEQAHLQRESFSFGSVCAYRYAAAQEVSELKKLSLKDLLAFWDAHVRINTQTRRKISVQVFGNKHAVPVTAIAREGVCSCACVCARLVFESVRRPAFLTIVVLGFQTTARRTPRATAKASPRATQRARAGTMRAAARATAKAKGTTMVLRARKGLALVRGLRATKTLTASPRTRWCCTRCPRTSRSAPSCETSSNSSAAAASTRIWCDPCCAAFETIGDELSAGHVDNKHVTRVSTQQL